eukprot:4297020-Amphidinium_carterae.2
MPSYRGVLRLKTPLLDLAFQCVDGVMLDAKGYCTTLQGVCLTKHYNDPLLCPIAIASASQENKPTHVRPARQKGCRPGSCLAK